MLQLMDLPPEIRQIIFIDSSKKARGTLQVLKLHLLARCDNPRHTEERPREGLVLVICPATIAPDWCVAGRVLSRIT